ncbi:SRPBCC family protein [Streptomyces sp. NPDC004330]|uniref:SRPBCC family protein n=1 Tax=Streptomyces sp. NPDC004330 TaxID=3364700 RepID=UPI00368A6A36
MSTTVKQTIDVDVPLGAAYEQWTRFEDFPTFMEGVEEVRQTDDRHCHWRTRVAGVRREFDTEIVDRRPDERVAWRTVAGDVRQEGVVSFQSLDAAHTRVRVALEVEPHGMAEKAAHVMGVLHRRVKGDLKRFKSHVEEHAHAPEARRGPVRPGGAAPASAPETGGDTPVRPTPQEAKEAWPLPPPPDDRL